MTNKDGKAAQPDTALKYIGRDIGPGEELLADRTEAIAHGLDPTDLEMGIEPFTRKDLYDPDEPNADRMLFFLNSWIEMITVLNEMSRSLGHPDFYPFVMSRAVVKKLHFVNLVITGARNRQA